MELEKYVENLEKQVNISYCFLYMYSEVLSELKVFEIEEALLTVLHQMTEHPCTSFLTAKEVDVPAALCET